MRFRSPCRERVGRDCVAGREGVAPSFSERLPPCREAAGSQGSAPQRGSPLGVSGGWLCGRFPYGCDLAGDVLSALTARVSQQAPCVQRASEAGARGRLSPLCAGSCTVPPQHAWSWIIPERARAEPGRVRGVIQEQGNAQRPPPARSTRLRPAFSSAWIPLASLGSPRGFLGDRQ